MSRAVPAIVGLLAVGCVSELPPRESLATWREVGSWSGRGNAQLETFLVEHADWRVHWEATGEMPGRGHLRVTAHSGDSGRWLADVVDHQGSGRGTVTMTEHPRRFYFVVESEAVDWSLVAEEPVPARAR